jgi:hypothetical protein
MPNYRSDWVPDIRRDLDEKLEELAKAGNRIISVVYRPQYDALDWGPGKPSTTEIAMFVIVSETNDAHRA